MDKFAIIFQPQNLQLYWTGLIATMELLGVSLIAGALLTLPLTLMRVSRNRWACAYTVEMLAGAIKETPAGEIEAAQAAGFGKWNMMFRLILPSAMRRTLPGYSNEVVMMLHATSLASVVPALYDLTNAAYAIYKTYYLAFQPFIFVAVLYFMLTFALVYVFRLLERRFLAYLRPIAH